MKHYPSTCLAVITSEDSFFPPMKDKRFHCVRMGDPRSGRIVAILPFVGTDEEQRARAEIMAEAMTKAS